MSQLKSHDDNYYIARVNKQNGEKTFLHYSRVRGVFNVAYGFEEATRYGTFDEARRLVDQHNEMSTLADGDYHYFICNLKTECHEMDSDGFEFDPKTIIKKDDENE